MTSRHVAVAFSVVGLVVIFCGLLYLSVVAALIILAGAALLALGLFAIEVPDR